MKQPIGYSRIQIRLHWVVAALIAAQYLFKDAIHTAWDAFSKGAVVGFDPLVMAHVAGGLLILAFAVWRIVLRIKRGAPQPPEEEAAALKMVAHVTHWTLYALMVLMPVTGALAWFGGAEQAAFAHNVLKLPLLLLMGLHVIGALFHQFILKTNILARMKTAQD